MCCSAVHYTIAGQQGEQQLPGCQVAALAALVASGDTGQVCDRVPAWKGTGQRRKVGVCNNDALHGVHQQVMAHAALAEQLSLAQAVTFRRCHAR